MQAAIHVLLTVECNVFKLQCKDDCITADNFQCYDYPCQDV